LLIDHLCISEGIFGIDLDELFEAELGEFDIGRRPVDGVFVLLEGMTGVMFFVMMSMVMLAAGTVLVSALSFSQLGFNDIA
jgi:hypothetical protein